MLRVQLYPQPTQGYPPAQMYPPPYGLNAMLPTGGATQVSLFSTHHYQHSDLNMGDQSESISPSSTESPREIEMTSGVRDYETPMMKSMEFDMHGASSNSTDEDDLPKGTINGGMECDQDGPMNDDAEYDDDEDEDGNDYRRFSGRSRKKTHFFGVNEHGGIRGGRGSRGRRGLKGEPTQYNFYTKKAAASERPKTASV